MAWAKPKYTKGQINRAGEILSLENPFEDAQCSNEEYFQTFDIVNNWRAVHSYPLQAMKMSLKRRAQRVCPSAIVAQRLKRLASIKLKLKLSREAGNHPSLSQMQDIGGCRAVMDSVSDVRLVENAFLEASKKNPNRGPQYSKKYDYIANPKDNGYRSVHLVYRFRSDSSQHSCYNGQRIEIQLRSRKQHYWATAVETYSTFSGEALKSNIGREEWKRFFALISSVIAIQENESTIPATPLTLETIRPELSNLYHSLGVYNVLSGWAAITKFTQEQSLDEQGAVLYLLVLDPETFTTTLEVYQKHQETLATAEYARIEKDSPKLQAVLVAVDSVAALRTAYPNYFLDTTSFLDLVRDVIAGDPAVQLPLLDK